jgi:hypothetical protein
MVLLYRVTSELRMHVHRKTFIAKGYLDQHVFGDNATSGWCVSMHA